MNPRDRALVYRAMAALLEDRAEKVDRDLAADLAKLED